MMTEDKIKAYLHEWIRVLSCTAGGLSHPAITLYEYIKLREGDK